MIKAQGATRRFLSSTREGLGQEFSTALFERVGTANDLETARALAAEIESKGGSRVVAASPVKTREAAGATPARWSVRLSYDGEKVPEEVRSMPSVRRVERTPVTTNASEGAQRGFRNLAITLALIYGTGAVGAGYLTYRYVVSSSSSEDT